MTEAVTVCLMVVLEIIDLTAMLGMLGVDVRAVFVWRKVLRIVLFSLLWELWLGRAWHS